MDQENRLNNTEKKKSVLKKWWFWILVLVGIFAVIFAIVLTTNYTKSPDSIAEDIQSEIRSDKGDFGNATVNWSADKQAMVVQVSEDSRVIKSMNHNETSLWNSLVRGLQSDSQSISDKNNKKYSRIVILSPKSSKYEWLELHQGDIKYNIADDIK